MFDLSLLDYIQISFVLVCVCVYLRNVLIIFAKRKMSSEKSFVKKKHFHDIKKKQQISALKSFIVNNKNKLQQTKQKQKSINVGNVNGLQFYDESAIFLN